MNKCEFRSILRRPLLTHGWVRLPMAWSTGGTSVNDLCAIGLGGNVHNVYSNPSARTPGELIPSSVCNATNEKWPRDGKCTSLAKGKQLFGCGLRHGHYSVHGSSQRRFIRIHTSIDQNQNCIYKTIKWFTIFIAFNLQNVSGIAWHLWLTTKHFVTIVTRPGIPWRLAKINVCFHGIHPCRCDVQIYQNKTSFEATYI